MFTAYVIITVLTIVANAGIAVADLARAEFVLANSAEVGLLQSWLPWLAALKAAGAAGLLLGLLGVEVVGVAAATGLVLLLRRRRRHAHPYARVPQHRVSRLLPGAGRRVPRPRRRALAGGVSYGGPAATSRAGLIAAAAHAERWVQGGNGSVRAREEKRGGIR